MANWRGFTYEGSPSNRTKTAPLDTYQAWGLMLLHYEQLADVVASCSVVGSQPEWRPDESDQKSLHHKAALSKTRISARGCFGAGVRNRRRPTPDGVKTRPPPPHRHHTACLLLHGIFLRHSLYPANMQTCEWNSLRCNGQLFFVVTFVSVRPLELFVV